MFGSIKKVKKGLPRVNPTAGFFGFLFKQLFTALAICFLALLSFLFFSSENPDPPFSLSTIKKASKHSKPLLPSVLGEETSSESPLVLTGNLSLDNPVPASQSFLIKNCRDCIDGKQIKNNSIGSSEIENKSITSSDIKSNQINSRTIENHSIRSRDLARNLTIQHLTVDNELIVLTTLSAPFLNTGQGNNELYAMDQDVKTTDTPFFAGLTLTGNLLFSTDNTLDIGTTGATRPRTGYFGTSIISPLINGLTITNNGTNTLNIAAGKTLTASNTLTFTGTDSSSIAFGAGGTVVYTADKLSSFAATTSAELAGVISDETGSSSGVLVFNNAPTITSPVITNIAPGANFTLTQNSVIPFTSVNTGAVANTLYLALGNVGIGTTGPGQNLTVIGNGSFSKSVHIGSAFTTTDRLMEVTGPHYGTATTLYGLVFNPTFPATTTTSAYGAYFAPATTASAFTLTNAYSLYVEQFTPGSGSTVTNNYGLYVKNGTTVLNATSGNVGIGTTSPGAALDVNGNIKLPAGNYIGTGGENKIQFHEGSFGRMDIFTANTERVSIKYDGNVGIGDASPGTKLSVKGASPTSRIWDTAGTNHAILQITAGDVNQIDSNGELASTAPLAFLMGGVEKVRITTNGNVGIGTTGPGTKLDVVDGSIRSYTTSTSVSSNVRAISGTTLETGLYSFPSSFVITALRGYSGVTGSGPLAIYSDSGVSSGGANPIVFATGGYEIGTTERMRIQSNGNVGIGTTGPGTKLTIAQSAASSGVKIFGYDGQSAKYGHMFVDASGYFNIDTGAAEGTYFSYGGVSKVLSYVSAWQFQDNYPVQFGNSTDFKLQYDETTNDWLQLTDGANNLMLTIKDQGTTSDFNFNAGKVFFKNDGNVGIGTTAPGATLQINTGLDESVLVNQTGTSYFVLNRPATSNEAMFAWEDAGVRKWYWGQRSTDGDTSMHLYSVAKTGGAGDVMTILNTGNVGIGTTGPTERLTVYNGSTTGTYTTSGWAHSSDERLKTNITAITNSLEKITSLNGIYFNWINNPNQDKQIGLSAQHTKNILPEVVVGNEETGYGISYGNLSALLIEGVKELNLKKADLTLLATNQTTIDQGFISLGGSIDEIEADLKKKIDLKADLSVLSQLDANLEALSEFVIGTESLPGLKDQVADHETKINTLEADVQALQAALAGAKLMFDAEGNLKVRTIKMEGLENTTQPVCDNSKEGTIYYDKTDKRFYGCNGTIWEELNSPIPVEAPEIP